jgi:hypothetical protein
MKQATLTQVANCGNNDFSVFERMLIMETSVSKALIGKTFARTHNLAWDAVYFSVHRSVLRVMDHWIKQSYEK